MAAVAVAVIAIGLGMGCAGGAAADEAGQGQSQVTPIYMSVVVHLEGWPVNQKTAFLTYTKRIREYVALIEKRGAVFTWESKDLIAPSVTFDDNILLELAERGQGVGLHADLGGGAKPGGGYTQQMFVNDLKKLKADMAALGVTPASVSGICSELDWVSAAADAGFGCATGHVGYCTASLGSVYVPEGYETCETPAQCHKPYPDDPAAQVNPWHAANGQTWTEQTGDGRVWLVHSVGAVNCAHEDRYEPGSHTQCDQADQADVDAIMLNLEETFAHADPERYNAVVMVWSFGMELDDNVFEAWLDRLDPYVRSGRLKWATVGEMCEGAGAQ